MAKCLLGDKKTKLCREIGGQNYHSCFVRGGWTHFEAECWFDDDNCDCVNYKLKTVKPYIRDGQILGIDHPGIKVIS